MSEHPEELEQDEEVVAAGVEPEEGADQSPEPQEPEPAPAGPTSTGIRYNDRVYCVGQTGSGKTELLLHFFSGMRCQRVLVDPKDEYGIAGVEPARDVDAIDWTQPLIHYIPAVGDLGEVDRLFSTFNTRHHLVVCCPELAELCDYQPNRTPGSVKRYITQGRTHGRGLLGDSQRPVSMPRVSRTEAEHVFVFTRPLDPDDHATVARMVGRPVDDLAQMLQAVQADHGEHSFVWFDKRAQEVLVCPPLPQAVRARTIARKRTVA